MPRATPMPPEERRSAIMAATEPLVETYGREVTTRQIAEAAGVAEGTIFRVFPSKDVLLDAVLEDALDPGSACLALRTIDRKRSLDDRLIAAVEVLQSRMRRVVALFHALRTRPLPPSTDEQRLRSEQDRAISVELAALIDQDADQLRISADEAATLLRSLTFAVSHPMINRHHAQPVLQPGEIVEIFLYGITGPAANPMKTSHLEDCTC